MVGCHLPQEGRKRATYSQVSQLSATVHLGGTALHTPNHSDEAPKLASQFSASDAEKANRSTNEQFGGFLVRLYDRAQRAMGTGR